MTDPVPPLPDSERRTSYSVTSATAGPFDVGFDLYGDGDDFWNWVEVWVGGAKVAHDDPIRGWSVASVSGPLSPLVRPITDATVTFGNPLAGSGAAPIDLQIVGARRPRRTTQFGNTVPPRSLNQAITDIVASLREQWDKLNRTIRVPFGETVTGLPSAADRANKVFRFDANGAPRMAPPTEESAAAAQDAADRAEAASANLHLPQFETIAKAQLGANIYPAIAQEVVLLGYYAAGDCMPAYYKYAAAEPAHSAWFQMADGTYWELANFTPDPFMFGAKGDGSNDQAAFDKATSIGIPVLVPRSTQYYALTSLTSAQLELLWGPGIVKVNGVVTPISSTPTFGSDDIAGLVVTKPDLTPPSFPGSTGSIGNAAADLNVIRTGGHGTFGSFLNRLTVTAALPAGEFDVGDTTWVTATNLTGGQIFGSWSGANTPAKNLGETYSAGTVIGEEINVGNRWADFGLLTDVAATRCTVGQQIVPDVLPAFGGVNTINVTSISIASPGVVTLNSHGLTAGMGVVFGGTGTIPAGLVKGQPYYVASAGLTANTFQVSATPGGASINTTGSFVGPINILPSWPGSFASVIGGSTWGHRWWVGTLLRSDTIMPGGYANYVSGGSAQAGAPGSWTRMVGYWGKGLDMSGVVFSTHAIDLAGAGYASGAPINFDFTATHSGTATAGGVASPGAFQGFLKLAMNGSFIKVPYFQN